MKKGKSRKCNCRKKMIVSQKRQGHLFDGKKQPYDRSVYDGSSADVGEPLEAS